MARVDPQTPIEEGDVIVRVGADGMACPKGAEHFIYPVIQLVWPDTERFPNPKGMLTIRWQDKLDATKPSKSVTPKYIGLMTDEGQQWIGYRVSDSDRVLFESLRKRWGMWFLRVSRQSEDEEAYFTFFNEGGYFAGSVMVDMPRYVATLDATELREMLIQSWQDTLNTFRKRMPSAFPDEDTIHRRFVAISKIPSILEEIGGGPLPWVKKDMPYWGKPDNKAHDAVVKTYLMLLRALQRNSLNSRLPEKFMRECGEMYDMLRRAKIFEISPESYVELHMEVDRYVTEEIAHLPFHDPRDAKVDVPQAESILLYERQSEACAALPFPDKLPFDVCYFAIAGVMAISEFQAESRQLKVSDGPFALAGILVDQDGEHHELLISQKATRGGDTIEMSLHISTHRVQEEASWQHQFCLAPFVLHAMVDCINDHQTTIVSQRKLGMQSQSKIRKGLGDLGLKKPIPPPFYTVHLRDKVIKEIAKGYSGGKFRAKYAHRFDVRGHWCFKIYRGPMPMDVEFELHLDRRKYDIYKNRPVDGWVREALQERDQPLPQEGEWMAIKRFWKNSYVKGPEGAQYVPSTRRATKGVLAFDNSDSSDEDSVSDEQAKTPAGSQVA